MPPTATEATATSLANSGMTGTHAPGEALSNGTPPFRHSRWVRVTHWVGTISFLLLVFSGGEILMVHPRLYWGNIGNDLTPALFELPISRNYHHHGWTASRPFFDSAPSPISAGRTYDIFNQNGWGRSLHFLNAWIFVAAGLVFLLCGIYTRHVQRDLLGAASGSKYGLLQKMTYCVVLFFLSPLVILTGLTMSPSVTASHPWLLALFFGAQSARTLHFFCAVLLVLFLFVHVAMVIRTGFRRNMRAMTFTFNSRKSSLP